MVAFWCVLSALGYVGATALMKYATQLPLVVAAVGILLAFAVATLCEIQALRLVEMGPALVVIIGLEAAIALAAGAALMGESYSPAQVVGVGLVIVGVMLIQGGGGQTAAQLG